jgi:hypothetical protein
MGAKVTPDFSYVKLVHPLKQYYLKWYGKPPFEDTKPTVGGCF